MNRIAVAQELVKLARELIALDSNLAIRWSRCSPSDVAYYKRIGLDGHTFEEASVELDDPKLIRKYGIDEVTFVKVDGKRYRVDFDKDAFAEE